MQSSARARRLGRDLRRTFDPTLALAPAQLVTALTAYLTVIGFEVRASAPRRLRGRQACIKPGIVFYDRGLDSDPLALLHALAHETGHALQHGRVHGMLDIPDPAQVMTLAAGQNGLAQARYSPVLRDEFQAEAFAVEFLCPSDQALGVWLADPKATSHTVAARFHTSVGVARAQLGEGFQDRVHSPAPGSTDPETGDDSPPVARTPHVAGERTPDDKQRLAITHTGSAALVDAGPGCGKTYTLVERIAWSLDHAVETARAVGPVSAGDATRIRRETAARTLVLTFSTEATGELEARIAARLDPEDAQEIHVSTFHGFGRQILAEYGEGLGVDARAPVLDENAQVALLLHALATPGAEAIINLKDPEETAREVTRHIQHVKQSLTLEQGRFVPWTAGRLSAHLDAQDDANPHAQAFSVVFSAYEALKTDMGAVDFADLIALPIGVLQDQPDVAECYQGRYPHILVDEYQDVSRAVSRLLELISGPDGEPWVVGDPNQSIYRFLNADPDNVARFPAVFGTEATFELASNYRSAPEIVATANTLATLLRRQRDPEASADDRFVAVGSETAAPALSDHASPVVVAVAESDAAEREGVAQTVADWIDAGVAPHDIAVLARRNVDVLEVALVLGRKGIRTAAGTVMTPDGAAGDLAAVISFADSRAGFRSALPRVAHALFRHAPEGVDHAVMWTLEHLPTTSTDFDEALDALDAPPEVVSVLSPVLHLHRALRTERFRGDAFAMLAAFLFDGSDYARRLLAEGDASALEQAATVLRRAEASTSLAQAAAYRHNRPAPTGADAPATARTSRLTFAAAFRRALGAGIPSAVAPPRVEGAVQIMTCHASKGLEFPHVCVVGQTLGALTSGFDWLPKSLQPGAEQDSEQADALLFVGVTRAQRSLVVSYSERPSAGKGKPRSVTNLLDLWRAAAPPHEVRWLEPENAASAEPDDQSADWGTGTASRVSAHHLDTKTCELSAYLDAVLRLHFPEAVPPLYPLYIDCLRRAVRSVLRSAHATGCPVAAAVARDAFERAWASVATKHADNPLLSLYERLGLRATLAFATAYATPLATRHLAIDVKAIGGALHADLAVSLGFVDAFHGDDGRHVSLVLRSESYVTKAKAGRLVWSAIGASSRQVPLAIFHEYAALQGGAAHVILFSAADGVLYDVAWSTRKTNGVTSMERLSAAAADRAARLAGGPYTPGLSTWDCPRCRSRVLCPHFLAAQHAG